MIPPRPDFPVITLMTESQSCPHQMDNKPFTKPAFWSHMGYTYWTDEADVY